MTGKTESLLREKLQTLQSDSNGCLLWVGTYASRPNKIPLYHKTNVRRFVWEENHTALDVDTKVHLRCKNSMCLSVKHMYILHSTEVVSGSKILSYDPYLYEMHPCERCGQDCRVRGKPKKGLSRGFIMPDGSRICGQCKRTPNRLALVVPVRYSNSVDALVEDVEWLLDFNETAIGSYKRLGFDSVEHLYKVLRTLDRDDLVTKFNNLGVINDA